jgi:competence protein ComEC
MLKLALFVAGIVCCAFLPVLPSLWNLAGLCLLLLLVSRLAPARPAWLAGMLLAFLLGLGYADVRAQWRLAQALPASLWQKPLALQGVVRGLPVSGTYGVRMQFEVEQVLTSGAQLPERVQLSVFARKGEATSDMAWHAGERWRLTARFRPLQSTANPHGFDAEQWYWSEGILATGTVQPGAQRLGEANDVLAVVDRLRERLVLRIETVLGQQRAAGLVAGLTVGAQQQIAREEWQSLARTGLTHVVSISGLHITMVAGMAAAIVAWLLRRWPVSYLHPRILIVLSGVMAAAAYAVLAGFSVPTQRTLYMLCCVALMLLWRRTWSGLHIWWLALAIVLLIDPFAVLAPGLWLSFGLVAALMLSSLGRRRPAGKVQQALMGQWAATVASLLPLLAMFGSFPLVSPLANALGIPFVSVLLTPASLLAVALPWDLPLQLAGWLAEWFYRGVDWLAQLPVWQAAALPWPLLLLGGIGSVWLLAPGGMPGRWLGGSLLLPVLFYQPAAPEPGTARIRLLDVGQGLAVLIQTHQHALLFDTGAAGGERWVLPQLRGFGIRQLDVLLLSHNDKDHDAATADIAAAIPLRRVLAGQAATLEQYGLTGEICQRGQSWVWDGVRFDVLWPPAGAQLPDDNSHSCVLRVASWRHAILISGDAPRAVEQQLVADYGGQLRSTVLVVGHHGSRTSTAPEWLETVAPQWSVLSVGFLNRYRHPQPRVLEALQAQGGVLRTDADGLISIDMGTELSFECYRIQAARYWRSPGNCGVAAN